MARTMNSQDEAAVRQLIRSMLQMGFAQEFTRISAHLCRYKERAELMLEYLRTTPEVTEEDFATRAMEAVRETHKAET